MSIQFNIDNLCQQICVYWGPTTNNEFGGWNFAAPVEIQCRWEEKLVLFHDKNGNQTQAKAVVHIVEDVKMEGYLMLGTIADIPSGYINTPKALENAYVIKRFDKSPAISDPTAFLRKAYLTPYGGMS